MWLGNILEDFRVNNMKRKKRINGYVYDFSVDYNGIDVGNTLDIHKCLRKNHDLE